MSNSLHRGIHALAILIPAAKAGGPALATAVLLAVLVVICVVWAAIWSGNQQRRKDALAVLDRLLRWKGR